MKRKILAVLIAVFALLSLTFGLTGCKENIVFDQDYIVGSYIDADGNLIIILADGTEINYGFVPDYRPTTANDFLFTEVREGDSTVGYAVRGLHKATSVNLVIPDKFQDLPVVEIMDGAFYMNDRIVSVIIPDTVKKIGAYAFEECTALKSVDLGEGVTFIGDNAFGMCYSLTEIEIPQSVAIIEGDAFVFCTALEKVTLSMAGELEFLGAGAFAGCSALKSFIMPDSVTAAGYGLFMQCTSLSNVALSDNLTELDDYTFSGCTSLTTFTFGAKSKITRIGYAAFSKTPIKSIVIPSGVTEIGRTAFFECANLTSVKLNANLERIDSGAFHSCIALEEITVPAAVNFIGQNTFEGCSKLKSVAFENYEDWKVYEDEYTATGVAISSSALSNHSNAANYLTGLHMKRFWRRGEFSGGDGPSGNLPW